MEWFDYGTHAPYIWTVYGIALVVFSANVIEPFLRHRRILQKLKTQNVDGQQS